MRPSLLAVGLWGWVAACAGAPDADTKSIAWDAGTAAPTPCEQLVNRTCGVPAAPDMCEGAPSCEAAHLISTYEPDRCEEKLQDEVHYFGCGTAGSLEGYCGLLQQKACGSSNGCEDSAGCRNARSVVEGGEDDACGQAYEDDTSFPRCVPPRG